MSSGNISSLSLEARCFVFELYQAMKLVCGKGGVNDLWAFYNFPGSCQKPSVCQVKTSPSLSPHLLVVSHPNTVPGTQELPKIHLFKSQSCLVSKLAYLQEVFRKLL
jgi:hypothetical protein